ncbi:MAG: thioredoxin [Dysgonamonadaceae bacterium]|jgi:thioredoxin 1|nr:thioredoxin [Dysgonamonadaceae bacterium]
MALQITDSSFSDLLNGDKPLVVDFWAEWCGPCRLVSPIIDELAQIYEGKVIIGKVNVDENENLPVEYGIRSIPTLLFFKDGKLIDRHVGGITKISLDKKIEALL